MAAEPRTEPLTPDVQAAVDAILARRDRNDMRPTIDALEALLAADPGHPALLSEVGGAYDTAGDDVRAVGFYERALAAGLDGDALRRCLLQYGSTLRNLDRFDESLRVLDRARALYPGSESVRLFHALSLHAAGRSDAAVSELMLLAADAIRTPDLLRYEASIRGNAEYLADLDAAEHPPAV